MVLLQGDCLEELTKIKDDSVQIILSDLPYGRTARNQWDKKISLQPLWKQFNRILKPNGVVALWAQMPYSAELVESNPKNFRYEWIIEKTAATGFLNAKKMPLKAHECVLIFYRSLPIYNPQMSHNHTRKVSSAIHKRNSIKSMNYRDYELTSYDSTDRYPRDVLRFKWDKQKSALHPTQKPVSANEYFIKTYTNEGDVVLDCCMGVGSTGVAALNTNRDFIGIEIQENYFEIAKERLTKNG